MIIKECFTEEAYSIECAQTSGNNISILFTGAEERPASFIELDKEELDEIISFLNKVKTIVFH